jgi:hypothetical protein
VSSDSWTQYAEYARRLDAVRAEVQARTAGMRQAVAEMTTEGDRLEALLNGQRGMLANLATELRFRPPKFVPIAPPVPEAPEGPDGTKGPVPEFEPSPGLGQLGGAIDRAKAASTEAATRGQYPAVLPKLTGTVRNLVFYGIAALLVLGLQARYFEKTGTEMNPIAVLFVIPLIGFGLAYIALRVGGRTRMATEPPDVSPRLGFLLCFLIGPIAAAVSVATSFQSKRP